MYSNRFITKSDRNVFHKLNLHCMWSSCAVFWEKEMMWFANYCQTRFDAEKSKFVTPFFLQNDTAAMPDVTLESGKALSWRACCQVFLHAVVHLPACCCTLTRVLLHTHPRVAVHSPACCCTLTRVLLRSAFSSVISSSRSSRCSRI